jgi:hypothetical protein
MNEIVAYVAAAIVFAWGVSHAIPTRNVVAGFSDTSADNRLVITQEWLAEAMTMWFIAALVVIATAIDAEDSVTRWVYRSSAVMLIAIGALTAVTGARTPVIFFKICPVLLTSVATLLLIASFV